MTTFTGVEDNENYTVTVSEIKTSVHNEKCVDITIDFDGDVEEVQFSEIRKGNVEGWMEDNLGIRNEEIKNYITNLF